MHSPLAPLPFTTLLYSFWSPPPPTCSHCHVACAHATPSRSVPLPVHACLQDRLEVIARARHNNVRALIVTGTNLTTSELARNFCATAYPMPPSASNHAAGGPTQEPNGHGRNVSGATAHSTGSSAAAAAGVTDGTVRGSGTAAGLSAVPLYFTAGVHPHHAKTCDGSTIAHLRALASHPQCVAVGETGLDFNRNFSPPDVQEHWFEQQASEVWHLPAAWERRGWRGWRAGGRRCLGLAFDWAGSGHISWLGMGGGWEGEGGRSRVLEG